MSLFLWTEEDLAPGRMSYNVTRAYRRMAVSSHQIKQEMAIYDTLFILRKSGLLSSLVLKGGHCTRAYLPITKHRYSRDLDFNIINNENLDIEEFQRRFEYDFNNFCEANRINSSIVSKESDREEILVFNRSFPSGRITSTVLLEINHIMPTNTIYAKPITTFLDLQRVDAEEIDSNLMGVEELFGEKLYICGRINGHRDAYDIYRISEHYPSIFNTLPKNSVHRFHQRVKLEEFDVESVIRNNKKMINKRLFQSENIAELISMSFERLDKNFIINQILPCTEMFLDMMLETES